MALNSKQGKQAGIGNAIKRLSSILKGLAQFISIQCGLKTASFVGPDVPVFRSLQLAVSK